MVKKNNQKPYNITYGRVGFQYFKVIISKNPRIVIFFGNLQVLLWVKDKNTKYYRMFTQRKGKNI